MATVELTAENLESAVSSEGLVLIDFWAAWCGPCRMFGPVFERVSRQHADMDEVRKTLAQPAAS